MTEKQNFFVGAAVYFLLLALLIGMMTVIIPIILAAYYAKNTQKLDGLIEKPRNVIVAGIGLFLALWLVLEPAIWNLAAGVGNIFLVFLVSYALIGVLTVIVLNTHEHWNLPIQGNNKPKKAEKSIPFGKPDLKKNTFLTHSFHVENDTAQLKFYVRSSLVEYLKNKRRFAAYEMRQIIVFDLLKGRFVVVGGTIDQAKKGEAVFGTDLAEGKELPANKDYIKWYQPIPALSPFETANWHQWNGLEENTVKNQYGVYDREGPCWEIVANDTHNSERVQALVTHAMKSKVFNFQGQLNQVLDYAQAILAPHTDQILAGEKLPADDIREAMQKNPPAFGWA